ncbi:MAG: NAD-dependent epimerase/dehydratase family protein [Actinomycetota bacterium]|nr:NAD-dependent epimerase/dehydratase family protein [Actinomycetota bacterium]
MTALVTGAGGFVGANLVRHLLATGHDPVAVVRPGGDSWRLADVDGAIEVVELDLLDPSGIDRTVRAERPEVIFHLAAYGAYSWQSQLDTMLAVNVRATEALLEAAREIGARLVTAGSSSEYGFQANPPREIDCVEPNSYYAVTKAAATHLCRLAAATHGQSAVTLRLYSVYGPWEEPGRMMPALVLRALAGGWPPLTAPSTARDFVWVGDACAAFLTAATSELADPGAVFNIATGSQTTLRQLVDVARDVFDVEAEPTWATMAPRAWDTSSWVGDPSAAAVGLGWHATTPLANGLELCAGWFRARTEIARRYAT